MVDDGTPAAFVPFHVEQPSHFLFHEPESVPLTPHGTIGEQGVNGPKASGYEMDATPQHVGLLSTPTPGLVTLASATGQYSIDWAGMDPYRGADLVYWERPKGGRVVNAGSIAFSGSLAVDPGVQAFVRNVLAHFGVPCVAQPAGDGGQVEHTDNRLQPAKDDALSDCNPGSFLGRRKER
jgi:hypothetical protein